MRLKPKAFLSHKGTRRKHEVLRQDVQDFFQDEQDQESILSIPFCLSSCPLRVAWWEDILKALRYKTKRELTLPHKPSIPFSYFGE